METRIFDAVTRRLREGKRAYWVLLDPDDFSVDQAAQIALESQRCGVHALLIGGSLLHSNHFDEFVAAVKKSTELPVLLFPGDSTQLSTHADALLYLSLVSGRNPSNLIGEHVKAAPLIKDLGIEPIPTAYMLVESGAVSSVEFMSNTRPLPRTKPAIAVAHALAAQYMGMKLIYLEAGSGAKQSVPPEMIQMVKSQVAVPVIVGGGIRDSATVVEKLEAGADIIVTGNMLRHENGISLMKEIAAAVNRF
ncbi:MAG: geranylgeranylglyceryl/heptaprenylglyceryl phosphate synthase [Chitinispirillaceae bacterium]|nr:geranylgeranylglyceryl/heptaprenylglyceryl phosphate synthase [Chitinispirillaceae bacterium]